MLLALQQNLLLGGTQFLGPDIGSFYLVTGVAISNRDYSVLFSGSGHTFTNTGTLPTGLSLSSGGVLSGTPTVAGTYSGIVIVSDSTVNSNSFTITVGAAITIRSGGGIMAFRRIRKIRGFF